MPHELRRQVTEVRALRALADPIRYRLLGHLMSAGPQTASECAAVVGASPSNCSYHLRQLARFGLVERVPTSRADGRDRPWRPTATGLRMGPSDDEGDPDPVAVAANRQLSHAAIDDAAASPLPTGDHGGRQSDQRAGADPEIDDAPRRSKGG